MGLSPLSPEAGGADRGAVVGRIVDSSRRARASLGLAALLALTLLLAIAAPAFAADDAAEADIILFWSESCPYCRAELEFLEELQVRYPQVRIEAYEVSQSEENQILLLETLDRLGEELRGVPVTVLGDQVIVGFNEEQVGAFLEEYAAAIAANRPIEVEDDDTVIDVPVIGDVDVGQTSLLVSTVLIAFVDGFNPCSLWVLSILLALVLNTGSRGRVLAVGVTFLTITAALYGVYILGLYSVLSYISYVEWIRIGIAIVALGFGLLNVKDYFAFRRGPSLTISDEHKPTIYRRIRYVAAPERPVLPLLGGTAVLAVGVSLVETPCTAGFPVLWADLVSQSGVGFAGAAMLFAVYMAVFLVDELMVLFAAVAMMRVTKLTETHGRFLKLAGGMVMITLAGVLVLAPELMESVGGAVAVFAVAAALTAGVAILDRAFGLTPDARRP